MLPPPKEPTVYGANSDFKILFNEKPPSERNFFFDIYGINCYSL